MKIPINIGHNRRSSSSGHSGVVVEQCHLIWWLAFERGEKSPECDFQQSRDWDLENSQRNVSAPQSI